MTDSNWHDGNLGNRKTAGNRATARNTSGRYTLVSASRRRSELAGLRLVRACAAVVGASSLFAVSHLAQASSQTWLASPTDDTWANTANWSNSTAPGATSGSTNTDTATFSTALSGGIGGSGNPIVIDANRNIEGITFTSSNVGAFVIGNTTLNALDLYNNQGGSLIQMAGNVTSAEVIAAPIAMKAPSSTNGTYTFLNNSTTASATLSFTGAITGNSSSSRPTQLFLAGNNTGANTISGSLSDPSFGQEVPLLTKSGNGTWILSGINTFSGYSETVANTTWGIQINAGVLEAENNAALGTNGTVGANLNNYINNGGTLELNASGPNGSITLNSGVLLTLNGGGTLLSNGNNTVASVVTVAAGGNVAITTTNASDVFTIASSTNGFTGGNVTSVTNISGPGTVVMNQTSNYGGNFSVNAGTLSIAAAADLGTSANGVTLNGGSLSTTNSSLLIFTQIFTVGSGNGTFNIVGGASSAQGSRVNLNTANQLLGSGALTINGNGSLTSTNAGGQGAFVINNSNSYSGAITLQNGGLLEYGNATPLGAAATIKLNGNAEVDVDSGLTATNAITVANSTNSVIAFNNGPGTFSGPITLNATGTIGLRDWYNYGAQNNGTISGNISGTGGLTVYTGTSGNAATLTLSGVDTYSGPTIVSAGTIVAGVASVANTSGAFGNNSAVTLGNASNAGMNITGYNTQIGSLSGGGTLGGNTALGAATLTIGGTSINATYAGVISGTGGSLIMNATGNQTLAGVNTYTGNTTVAMGTLALSAASNNNIASSPVISIASGATLNTTGLNSGNIALGGSQKLTGLGSVTGGVSTASGTVITPGTGGNGTLSITGGLTLNSGAVLNYGLSNSLATNNLISVGTLTLPGSGNDTLNLYIPGSSTPFVPGSGSQTYDLIAYSSSASSGNVTSDFSIGDPNSAFSYVITANGSDIVLTTTQLATAAQWNVTNSGNWSNSSNWTGGVPMNPGDTATFGQGTALQTVTLDANEPVGGITMTSTNSYVIANAGNTLNLANNGLGATVIVTAGTANAIQTAVSLNDNATITVSGGASLSISGNVSGNSTANTLTVNGAGTLALSGANTYGPASSGTVGTTLSGGGILQLGSNTALGAGDLSITGNSTVQSGAAGLNAANNMILGSSVVGTIDSQANTFTLSGNISGSGALTKIGTGTLALTSTNSSYSGGTLISAGIVSIAGDGSAGGNGSLGAVPSSATANNIILNGGDLLGNANITLNANRGIGLGPTSGSTPGTGYIDAAAGQTFTIGGIIAAAGTAVGNNLTINGFGGTGTVVLSGNDTYSGATVISGGTLKLGTALALQDSTLNYNNQGGTLSFGTLTAATFGGLSGNQNLALVNASSSAVALSVGISSGNTTYSGTLSGNGSLTGIGGTLTLSGSNSYTGGTRVTSGTIAVSSTGSIGSTGTPSGGISVTGGGAFQVSGGSVTTSSLADAVGTDTAGAITISGNSTFTVTGTTQLGQTANSGAITVSGGNVSLGTLTDGRDSSNSGTANTGSGLIVNGGTVTATSANISTANSGGDLTVNGGSLTIGNATSTGAFVVGSGSNSGRGGFLTVTGGNLTYNGTDGLKLATSGTYGVANLTGGTTTLTGVTLDAGNSTAAHSSLTLNGSGAALYIGGVGIVENAPSGAVVSISLTNGILGATAPWSSSAPMTLGNATIQTADSSGNAENITLTGALSGTNLTKTGNGTLFLASGGNGYTGITTISAGTLNITGEWQLGGGAYGGLTFNGGTLQYAPGVSQLVGGNATGGTGDITAQQSGNNTNGTAETVTIGANGGTIDTNGNAISYANTIGNSGNGSLTIADSKGTGALTLLAAASYTGGTTINSGATLQLGNGTAGFDGTIATTSSITNNGTLIYNRGGNLTSSVPISGSGAVTKLGVGSQTLTGSNSYSGGTTISAGTLFANNATSALGNGTVNVNGGTLAGNGTIANGSHALSVNSGGTIAAGATATSIGKLASGQQAWAGNGTYAWKISNAAGGPSSGAGTNWDELTMSALTVTTATSNPFIISVNNAGSPATNITFGSSYTWVIADVTGNNSLQINGGPPTLGVDLITGSSSDAFALNTSNFSSGTAGATNDPSNFGLEAVSDGGGGDYLELTYNATPEPGTGLLVLAGGLPMFLNRRRRRESAKISV